jgi:hypothetical protein
MGSFAQALKELIRITPTVSVFINPLKIISRYLFKTDARGETR